MALPFNKEEIINKVKAGKELTREEDLYYLTEICGFDKEHAERILSINELTTDNRIID